MRRQIWLATDAAYKRAVSTFARKKAAFQNRAAATDAVPDFSAETPLQTSKADCRSSSSIATGPIGCEQISAVFSSTPSIESSEVSVADTRGTRYFLNSEGFKVVAPMQIASVRVVADARADDGRSSATSSRWSRRTSPTCLRSARSWRAPGRWLQRITAQRTAPIADEYAGPDPASKVRRARSCSRR